MLKRCEIQKKECDEHAKIPIDHADIVTSHKCNNNCPFCIDSFIHSSDKEVSLEDVDKFLRMLRTVTDKNVSILLLGGDPTMLSAEKLIAIADLVHSYGFRISMSTNGIQKDKIIQVLPWFDWVQITLSSDKQIDFWRPYREKINAKWSGDQKMTLEKMEHFIEYTKGFGRRSVSMYFTPHFHELCEDEQVWKILDTLEWKRNGSYEYAFYKGVRFKKCIHGETNIIDEPIIPKLYPNGNYNKTWSNEELDDYLTDGQWTVM